MLERERLMKLLEALTDAPRDRIEAAADYLIKNGVVALPVAVGSPCKIRKVINRIGKVPLIEVEDAVVREVCVLTESKSGSQIMSLSNVFPISEE